MELLKNEKELSKHDSLIVTNKRLIQEKKSWEKRIHKEIPLNKIDSICFEYSRNISLIIVGCVLIFLGLFWFLKIVGIIFGIIIIIIGSLLKKEFVEFSSCTLKIREEKENLEEFIDIVKEEIYKK